MATPEQTHSEPTPAEGLAIYLQNSADFIRNLRRKYGGEVYEDDSNDPTDYTDPENYLKDVFSLTTGWALANAMYGRPEFYSEPVMAWFQKNKDMAYVWDPIHILPFVDLFRHQFIAPTFAFGRPDHRAFALDTVRKIIASPSCRELIAIDDYEGENAWDAMRRALHSGNFDLIEKLGFACIARQSCYMLLHLLVQSGHFDPFIGVGNSRLDDSLLADVVTHIVNSNSTAHGIPGRAMVIALVGYTMRLGEGRTMAEYVGDEHFETPDLDDWCVKVAFESLEFGLKMGFSENLADYPCASDFGKPSLEDLAKRFAELSALVKGNA